MKYLSHVLLFCSLTMQLFAQQDVDSLKKALTIATNDSSRYFIFKHIYDVYEESNRDSALHYADLQLQIAKKNRQKHVMVVALDNKAYQLQGMGRYAEALQFLLQAFQMAEDASNDKIKTWPLFTSSHFTGNNRLLALAYTHHIFAILMWQTQNSEQELIHFKEARRISIEIGHNVRQMLADMNLGRSYQLNLNKLDSALFFEKEAEGLAFQTGFKKYLGQIYNVIGIIHSLKGEKEAAKKYYYKSVDWCLAENNLTNLSNAAYFSLAKFYLKEGEKDSSLHYALKNFEVYRRLGSVNGLGVNLGTIYQNIYLSYKLRGQKDSAYKYMELTLNATDSLAKFRIKNLGDFQKVILNEQLRLQEIEKQKVVYENKVRTYGFVAGLVIILLIALTLYRNNRQKHRAKVKIEKAYNELKTTQTQLIQSEKMASLGELTAGIAHEIQNPLNFVNNFSDVNKELLEELKEEVNKGNIDEVKAIADDVINNEEKINHHGKRADGIVKGMLQHSRTSSGQKEMTDINALCDEYLRLSYHGLRAKDKSFNAKFETDFDTSLPKINVVPQEIGRVILNLINNAFYAVNERKKLNEPGYEPTVWIKTTQKTPPTGGGKGIFVSVKDNGTGIPEKIKDKIFQPFFTTKPTGSGTGLGLSLSYDIVTKGHGGELKVETKEGEGSEFVIFLPAQ